MPGVFDEMEMFEDEQHPSMMDQSDLILLEHNTDFLSLITHSIPNNEDIWTKSKRTDAIIPGEEIWQKFDFDFQMDAILESDTQEQLNIELNRELKNHDCMWSGLCTHSEHGDPIFTPPSSPIFLIDTPKVRPVNSRSLLVKKYVKTCKNTKFVVNKFVKDRMGLKMGEMNTKLGVMGSDGEDNRPDTPVSDFDEPSPLQHDLNSDTSDFSDSEDLTDSSGQIMRDGFVNDHSYHIVKPTIKTELLGVQTPSDSEEEIDVVSLGEKTEVTLEDVKAVTLRTARNLPTNPSPSDKQHLQLSMAMAVKKTPNSTVPPLRIRLESKRKAREEEGVPRRKRPSKRRPQQDSSASSSPRKQRGSRCSSDSEEGGKRSLHNTMERQRRIELRNAFEGLRALVPRLADSDKAPKVHILKESMLFCRALQGEGAAMLRRQNELKRKQVMLRDRVSALRRSLAASR